MGSGKMYRNQIPDTQSDPKPHSIQKPKTHSQPRAIALSLSHSNSAANRYTSFLSQVMGPDTPRTRHTAQQHSQVKNIYNNIYSFSSLFFFFPPPSCSRASLPLISCPVLISVLFLFLFLVCLVIRQSLVLLPCCHQGWKLRLNPSSALLSLSLSLSLSLCGL